MLIQRAEVQDAISWDARPPGHPQRHRHICELGRRWCVGVERKRASELVGQAGHLGRKVHAGRVTVDLQRDTALGGFPENQLEVVRRALARAWTAPGRMADHVYVWVRDRTHHPLR